MWTYALGGDVDGVGFGGVGGGPGKPAPQKNFHLPQTFYTVSIYAQSMSKPANITLNETILAALSDIPSSRSAAMAKALFKAQSEPQLLAIALSHRINNPTPGTDKSICYSRDIRVEKALQELKALTQLTAEEVMRLAIEAYIYHL